MSSSTQWLIDFVQHLRTVHFALVFFSCGLIVVGVGYSSSASKALPVVDEISRFCKQWPDDWVEGLRPKKPAPNIPNTLYFLIPPKYKSAYWQRSYDPEIFDDGSFKVRWVKVPHGKEPGDVP